MNSKLSQGMQDDIKVVCMCGGKWNLAGSGDPGSVGRAMIVNSDPSVQ